MTRKPKDKQIPKGKSRKGTQPSSTGKVRNVKADQTTWRVKLQQSRLKFDDEQKALYLTELAQHGLKGRAAQAAGVCPNTVNMHADNDEDFSEARTLAIEEYRDKVVDHVGTLVLEGIEVRKYDKEGNLIEERRDFPIPLITLEARRVEPGYRDKQTIDLNTTGAGGVLLAPAGRSPEEAIKEGEAANEVARKKRDAEAAAAKKKNGNAK